MTRQQTPAIEKPLIHKKAVNTAGQSPILRSVGAKLDAGRNLSPRAGVRLTPGACHLGHRPDSSPRFNCSGNPSKHSNRPPNAKPATTSVHQ